MGTPKYCPKCGDDLTTTVNKNSLLSRIWGTSGLSETYGGKSGHHKMDDDVIQCDSCGHIIDMRSPRRHVSFEEY